MDGTCTATLILTVLALKVDRTWTRSTPQHVACTSVLSANQNVQACTPIVRNKFGKRQRPRSNSKWARCSCGADGGRPGGLPPVRKRALENNVHRHTINRAGRVKVRETTSGCPALSRLRPNTDPQVPVSGNKCAFLTNHKAPTSGHGPPHTTMQKLRTRQGSLVMHYCTRPVGMAVARLFNIAL